MVLKATFGLGNPGSKYKKTRHNVGFMIIDHYLAQLPKRKKAHRISTKVNSEIYRSENLLLVKPMTFMNRSGTAVKEVCHEFGLDLEDCLVIYDDLDIELGRLKAKFKGGAGGHKGMQSIIATMETDKVPRLKVGIGDNINLDTCLAAYVLEEFTEEENKVLMPILDKACEAIELFRNSGISFIMNRVG
jgi:PTH1 family peptidyl-tRNA hydrolase